MTQNSITAIRALNARLLTLAETADDIPITDIERAAKAITALIKAVEQAEGYIAATSSETRPGDHLDPEEEAVFKAKLQRMIDNGYLKARSHA